MLPIADFLFPHSGTQLKTRKLRLLASDRISSQLSDAPADSRNGGNHILVTSPSTPLVVLPADEQRTLIHAIAILYARGLFPRVTLAGVDSPRVLMKMQLLAKALNVRGQIHFIDESTQVPSANSHHQLLAITPQDRDMPGLLADAMAAGCALVGSSAATCAQTMIDNGVNGHLVPPLNPQALASVLEKLLRDSGYALQLGRAGKARTELVHQVSR